MSEQQSEQQFDMFMLKDMLARMSLEQWRIFMKELARVMQVGYGSVTLQVKNGKVRFVEAAPRIELPDPAKDGA